MSVEQPFGCGQVEPTIQEKLLMRLNDHDYEGVVRHVVADLEAGHSPSVLSIARPDVLTGFAETWQREVADLSEKRITDTEYKVLHFENLVEVAVAGDPAAIEALSKFVTSLGAMTLATTLILDNKESIKDWHTGRRYIQYLGSFDPQHIGHRVAIQSSLEAEGDLASAVIHVMGQHPRKPNFSATYEDRFKQSEERLYKSNLLDNRRITQVDVPGGVGLAEEYPKQMELIASLSGDDEYRWLTGSDKLLLDASTIRQGRAANKAITRFSDPKMHAYVVHRQSDDRWALENSIDFVIDRFGTRITLVEELPYDCAPASSSRVKQLRAEGRENEASHMELYELQ